MLDFPRVPLGCDKVDDRAFDLLKRIAGFPQQSGMGIAQFLTTRATAVMGVILSSFHGQVMVLIHAHQRCFHIEQGAGDIQQCAVVSGFSLVDQAFHH